MPQVRTPTPSPIARTLAQGVMDLFAAMGKFRQVQAVMHLAPLRVFHPYQGYPAGFGTGIKLQGDRLHLTGLLASILEPDGEGPHPMDHCSFATQQQARSSL